MLDVWNGMAKSLEEVVWLIFFAVGHWDLILNSLFEFLNDFFACLVLKNDFKQSRRDVSRVISVPLFPCTPHIVLPRTVFLGKLPSAFPVQLGAVSQNRLAPICSCDTPPQRAERGGSGHSSYLGPDRRRWRVWPRVCQTRRGGPAVRGTPSCRRAHRSARPPPPLQCGDFRQSRPRRTVCKVVRRRRPRRAPALAAGPSLERRAARQAGVERLARRRRGCRAGAAPAPLAESSSRAVTSQMTAAGDGTAR